MFRDMMSGIASAWKRGVLAVAAAVLLLALAVSVGGGTARAEPTPSGGASSYTVEFHYDGQEYVLEGGGTVALSTIQGELGIEGDVAAAASSDDALVAVAQDGSGWTVASLAPFSTEESLTLDMADGSQVVVSMTDPGNASPKAIENLTYTGSAQTLIDGGDAPYEPSTEQHYALVAHGGAVPAEADYTYTYDNLPTGTDAGSYDIYYYAGSWADPDTYWIGQPGPVTATIAPADLTNVSVSQVGTLTYNGKGQTLEVTTSATAVNDQPVTFTYRYGTSGDYSASLPSVVGNWSGTTTYTFYYKASAPNHNDAEGSFKVTIVGPISVNAPTAVTGLVYTGSEQTGVAAGTGYTIAGNTATDAGSYTATATLESGYVWNDGNKAAKTIDWSIAQAQNSWTAEPSIAGWKTGGTPSTPTAAAEFGTPAFSYYTDSACTQEFAPSASTPAGTYYLKAAVEGTSNYAGLSTTVSFEVAALTPVDAPTAITGLVYTGAEQTGVAAGTGYTLTGNTATDAGSYTATATLAAGYVWSDNTTDPKTVAWSIAKADLTDVDASQVGTLTYNGTAQTPEVTTSATSVNNQPITFTYRSMGSPYSTTLPTFTDGAVYTILYKVSAPNHNDATGSFNVTVNPMRVAIPTAATGLVYNGSEQTGVAGGTGYLLYDDAAGALVDNSTGTNAGTYRVTAFLNNPVSMSGMSELGPQSAESGNYVWNDDTYRAQTIDWSIAQAQNSWTTLPSIADWTSGTTPSTPTAAARFGTPTFSYFTDSYLTQEFTPSSSTPAGTYYLKATVEGTDNYTGDWQAVSFEVAALTVDAPTAIPGLVYDGTEQTGVAAGTGYTLAGNTATDAGSYAATATLTAGYVWSDGTTAPKTVAWSIAQAPNSWSTLPSIPGWTAGGEPTAPAGTSVYGVAAVSYFTDEACTEEFTPSASTPAGTYYMKIVVAGTEDYAGLAEVVPFTVAAAPETPVPPVPPETPVQPETSMTPTGPGDGVQATLPADAYEPEVIPATGDSSAPLGAAVVGVFLVGSAALAAACLQRKGRASVR